MTQLADLPTPGRVVEGCAYQQRGHTKMETDRDSDQAVRSPGLVDGRQISGFYSCLSAYTRARPVTTAAPVELLRGCRWDCGCTGQLPSLSVCVCVTI